MIYTIINIRVYIILYNIVQENKLSNNITHSFPWEFYKIKVVG